MSSNANNFILGFSLGGSVIGLVAFGLGEDYGISHTRPTSVYSIDVNQDNRQDIIVRNNGENYIFLQQEDGSYKIANEILRENLDSLEAKARELGK